MFLTIIIFILILGLLVFVHEFGHFIVAKKNGVQVEEFGFGFPPRIFSKRIKGTVYSINLIPLGGFVKENQKDFNKQSIIKRFKILSAGVIMNILLGVLCLTIVSVFAYPWYKGIFMGVINTFYLIGLILAALFNLLKDLILLGRFSGDVLGPIGIASITGQFVQEGLLSTFYFIALLSINLAIINSLPFPALDGGRLLFLAIERIKGKPVSQKTEKIVHGFGFAMLIALMVIITWRDIVRFL
ncbi:MAG: site-2 protease family protein [bacterium]